MRRDLLLWTAIVAGMASNVVQTCLIRESSAAHAECVGTLSEISQLAERKQALLSSCETELGEWQAWCVETIQTQEAMVGLDEALDELEAEADAAGR
jgi:hypothetical protein